MFTLHDILDIAIQIEYNGERVYRQALKVVNDKSLAALFKWLADEEVNHAETFVNMQQKAEKIIDDPKIVEMGKSMLQSAMKQHSFGLNETDLMEMRELEDVLALSIEFEKDTALFYQMLRPFLEDQSAIEQLDTIIEEELRHADRLHMFLDKSQQTAPQ